MSYVPLWIFESKTVMTHKNYVIPSINVPVERAVNTGQK